MAARRELARRQAARTSLLAFADYTLPSYRAGHPHRLIAERLEAVERGDVQRLMIFAPPRHGKSELVSRRFPAWYLGRHPGRQFISASYGADLAGDFGRDVRNIIASSEFAALFPGIGLAEDSAARNRWHTNRGGSYVAAGVGTAITGRGADILSIDDPVKDREAAESAAVRDATWNWFTSTAYTRLMPGGAIVLTMTRWHEGDLAGRLLAGQAAGGERWDVLSLPALDDAGEALWPDAYDAGALGRIRTAIGERDWAALYMQAPRPAEGAMFRVERIGVLDAVPAGHGPMVRAWDLAATRATGGRDPDWTVGLLLKRLPDERLVVLDVVRLRGGPDEVERAIVNTASRDGWGVRISLPQDPGQAGRAQVAYLTRQLQGFRVDASPESGDKVTRAMPVASQANAGNLTLLRAGWNRALLDELAAFPAGSHDDQVDALSRAFAQVGQQTYDLFALVGDDPHGYGMRFMMEAMMAHSSTR
jgi:predicted phage terminase large subunit-like protein